MTKNKVIHKVTLGERGWIARTKEDLTKQIDKFLSQVKQTVRLENKVLGLVVPHAGYRYSGQAAAYAYEVIKDKPYKRVIILGTAHYAGFRGIAVSEATHYETSLGEIPVDTEVCKAFLATGGLFRDVPAEEQEEHSVDIQLPFLQSVLKDFRLVPLIVGELKDDDYQKTAEIIQQYVDDDTLVIASSDFTHYGARFRYTPFKDNLKENIKKLDFGAIEYIKGVNPTGFLDYIKKTGATICGHKPIALLETILPDTEGELLHYYTSGDLENDYTNSVSYASMVLTEYQLNKDEQSTLLKLARDTLKTYLGNNKKPDISTLNWVQGKLTPKLKRTKGAFVTLKINKRLRGCIGTLRPSKSLYEDVIDNAINAAVNDRRFNSITLDEEKDVHIEITVLSSLKRVGGPDDIVVGKHGVWLIKGGYSATFLPQVAPEQGWNRNEMLEHLCAKAGLPSGAWKDKDTKFYVYTGQIIEEESHGK